MERAEYGQPEQSYTQDSRPTQVGNEIGRQSEEIDQLHHTLDSLEARLAGVMLPLNESPEKPGSSPEEVRVAMADQLHNHNRKIAGATRRVSTILERLEL